jgi:nicotinamide-nucleotide adenylyltransferase
MKRGIFIGRFQPLHIGHLSVIDDMNDAKDLDEIIIGIGTAQCSHTLYNPFSAEERREMIERSINISKPYTIINIPDINDFPKWVSHVESLAPKFDVIYSGNTIVKTLFEERGYEVRSGEFSHNISATEIRKMMIEGSSWGDYVPEGVREVIAEIRGVQRLRNIAARYMQPAVTADMIINYKDQGIVLIKRKDEPFKDCWALPGGHINTGLESIEETAVRETKEETSLDVKLNNINLLGVYSNPGRDPRGPYHSTAFYTKVESGIPIAADDALEVGIFKIIPDKLAFDHKIILEDYFQKIRGDEK